MMRQAGAMLSALDLARRIRGGTQTGGSAIRPAAFCGVAGFKPSDRLIPTIGVGCTYPTEFSR
jgi:Asp-tRNA(Asn)/Glu-tRNA(Gln) amidotransferase A subunit family amidase